MTNTNAGVSLFPWQHCHLVSYPVADEHIVLVSGTASSAGPEFQPVPLFWRPMPRVSPRAQRSCPVRCSEEDALVSAEDHVTLM